MRNTSKRSAEDEQSSALKAGQRPDKNSNNENTLDFEDEFEDEFESEDDEIMEAGVDGRADAEREAEESKDAMEVDVKKETFILGRSHLQEGQSLAPDLSVYETLHLMSTPWPCLSFDIVRDNLGENRTKYPKTLYCVAGTQAGSNSSNEIMILKLSGLGKNRDHSDSENDSDSDDDEGSSDPVLESRSISLNSSTNRIRHFQIADSDSSKFPNTLVATSIETGHVLIHDVSPHLNSLSYPGSSSSGSPKPISTLRMQSEGYALDWAPSTLRPLGHLLSGDCAGQIYSTQRTEGGGWTTDSRLFQAGHGVSTEDVQWSSTEKNVFASCGTDGTVKVFDLRSKSRKPAIEVQVSSTDVNVMSWNKKISHLLATGADDGQWAVWDLRQWKPQQGATGSSTQKPSPVANFDFHKKPITSIEWYDDSTIGLSSSDNSCTIWDLSVETDDEQYHKENGLGLGEGASKVPPQCLFIHYVEDPKEIHWHSQMPGTVMTTGAAGFGVFRTISV